jgi:hypothetical protein
VYDEKRFEAEPAGHRGAMELRKMYFSIQGSTTVVAWLLPMVCNRNFP